MNGGTLKTYIEKVLHTDVKIGSLKKYALPNIITQTYDVYLLSTRQVDWVVMSVLEEEQPALPSLKKHLRIVQEATKMDVAILSAKLPAARRDTFIEKGIPFIVIDKQLYLPFMAVAIQEEKIHQRKMTEKFSPSTQALLLYSLVHAIYTWTAKEAARVLQCSLMTSSRVFAELQDTERLITSIHGKPVQYQFRLQGKALWEEILPHVQTPVKEKRYVLEFHDESAQISGIAALANYSSIASDGKHVLALSQAVWKEASKKIIKLLPEEDDGCTTVEIWRYDSRIISDGIFVDPYSLALSLKDTNDERILSAIEGMIDAW